MLLSDCIRPSLPPRPKAASFPWLGGAPPQPPAVPVTPRAALGPRHLPPLIFPSLTCLLLEADVPSPDYPPHTGFTYLPALLPTELPTQCTLLSCSSPYILFLCKVCSQAKRDQLLQSDFCAVPSYLSVSLHDPCCPHLTAESAVQSVQAMAIQ